MGQEGREREMKEDGRLDALVQKKALLLGRYLSVTEQMRDCLLSNQTEKLGDFLARRQTCMEEVNKNDTLLSKAVKEQPGRGLIELDHAHIRSILLRIESLELELTDQVRKETETLKEDLLKMRTFRAVTGKYLEKAEQTPRFLDVRNQ
jgi:hypothetical protein